MQKFSRKNSENMRIKSLLFPFLAEQSKEPLNGFDLTRTKTNEYALKHIKMIH